MTVNKQSLSEDELKDIKKVAKGAGISFIGSVIGRCLWLTCQAIIARFFGAEIFGLYVLGLIVLKVSGQLARLGLQSGALRFVSIYRKDSPGKVKGTIISAILISFISGILMGWVVYVSADFVSETIFHNPALIGIIKTFAPCVPFLATITVVASVSRGFHTAKYSVYLMHIIQPSANIVFLILFILLGLDIFGVIIAYTVSHGIALLFGICFIGRQFPEIKQRIIKPIYETKKLLNYSAPLLFSGFLVFLISWVDSIMLGYMKTSTDVGIYRAASQVPLLLLFVVRAFSFIYAPAIAEMHHCGHIKRLEKLLKTSTLWIFYMALPATLILIFSAKEIMAIFGSDYVEIGAQILIVLAIAQFINCVKGGVDQNLVMTGKQHIEVVNTLIMFAINIILNCLLIPIYGSLGAAIATGISIVVINLLRLLEVYIFYKIHPYNMYYIRGIVCGIISIIILYFFGKFLPNLSDVLKFISNSLIVGLIFVISFIITNSRDEDRFILDVIMKKFKLKHLFQKI